MIDVFFVSMKNRGNDYGIGSFQKALTCQLGKNKGFKLHYIYLCSDKYNEYTVINKEGMKAIHIPPPLYKGGNKNKLNNEYYKAAAQLIRTETNECVKPILHFNTAMDISAFKQILPECKIVYTAHTLLWKFDLNGNIARFEKIWTAHKSGYGKNAQSVVGDKKEKKSIAVAKLAALATKRDTRALQQAIKQQNIINNSDICICVTQYAISHFIKKFSIAQNKFKLIYNGVKLTSRKPPTAQAKLEAKMALGFTKDERIVLYVGRLDNGKGIESLIQAFANLIEQAPDTKLVIVGNGNFDYYLKLCRQFPCKVVFTGRVEHQNISNYYLAADIGVIPSFFEQCSYVALEMMQHALAIVATAVDGLDEIFTENVNALKVNVNLSQGIPKPDIEQLTQHLHTLLSNDELRMSLGRKALKTCIKQFQVEKMVGQTIANYERLVRVPVNNHIGKEVCVL